MPVAEQIVVTPESAAPDGTYDSPLVLTGTFESIIVSGPVHVVLDAVTVDGAGETGLLVKDGASVAVTGGLTVQGAFSGAAVKVSGARLKLSGSVSLGGWSTDGLSLFYGSQLDFAGACDLSIVGPGAGYGIHLFAHSRMICYAPAVNVTVSEVQYAFQLGLLALCQLRSAGGEIVCRNASAPANSAAVQGTDHSSWSTTMPFTADRFTRAFDLNSISYAEATGTRTLTNLQASPAASQNSVIYLP